MGQQTRGGLWLLPCPLQMGIWVKSNLAGSNSADSPCKKTLGLVAPPGALDGDVPILLHGGRASLLFPRGGGQPAWCVGLAWGLRSRCETALPRKPRPFPGLSVTPGEPGGLGRTPFTLPGALWNQADPAYSP